MSDAEFICCVLPQNNGPVASSGTTSTIQLVDAHEAGVNTTYTKQDSVNWLSNDAAFKLIYADGLWRITDAAMTLVYYVTVNANFPDTWSEGPDGEVPTPTGQYI